MTSAAASGRLCHNGKQGVLAERWLQQLVMSASTVGSSRCRICSETNSFVAVCCETERAQGWSVPGCRGKGCNNGLMREVCWPGRLVAGHFLSCSLHSSSYSPSPPLCLLASRSPPLSTPPILLSLALHRSPRCTPVLPVTLPAHSNNGPSFRFAFAHKACSVIRELQEIILPL